MSELSKREFYWTLVYIFLQFNRIGKLTIIYMLRTDWAIFVITYASITCMYVPCMLSVLASKLRTVE